MCHLLRFGTSVIIVFWILLNSGTPAHSQEPFTLEAIVELVEQHHPGLQAARAEIEAARGGRRTAAAYPNPAIEFGTGPSRFRGDRGGAGRSKIFGLSQPLDYPSTRAARIDAAEAGIDAARAGFQSSRVQLLAQVRTAFYDILRREEERKVAQEDLGLLEQIRNRVKLRVEIGESPKYEQVKAEAEVLSATKNFESATLRVSQAKSVLRNFIGPPLPGEFEVKGVLASLSTLPALDELRREVGERNPDITRSLAVERAAGATLNLQRRLRFPQITLQTTLEEDPDLRQWRFGISLPLPVWDRRRGPIAEASAVLNRSQFLSQQSRLTLTRELETVYHRYLIANRQVDAFERGLLKEAENAMKVAETAYRLGERGVLDFLDAQRVLRSVRLDFINARYELQAALVEIQRLSASDLDGRNE